MRPFAALVFLSLPIPFFGCAGHPAGSGVTLAEPLFLRGATLVDPASRTSERGNLLIQGSKIIARLGADAPTPSHVRVVELSGKFVLPGLIDLHVHSWGNSNVIRGGKDDEPGHAAVLARMLYAGVTATLDLGSDPGEIFPLRDRQRAHPESVPGATLFAAGPVLGFWAMPTPEDARMRVRELAKRNPDIVKMLIDHAGGRSKRGWSNGKEVRAIVRAVVGEAKKHGLKVVTHIGTWEDASDAVEGGISAITHLFDSERIPVRLARRMKTLGVVEIPTMAVQGDLFRVSRDPHMLDDRLLAAVTPPWLLADYRKSKNEWKPRALHWLDWQGADIPVDYESIGRLYSSGVTLLAGSDSGNFAAFQGYSAHREIQILREAGLPAWDALAAGTTRAARFLGLHYGFEKDSDAELLVLKGSPLEKIGATEEIEAVVHLGRYLDRPELEKLKPLMGIDER